MLDILVKGRMFSETISLFTVKGDRTFLVGRVGINMECLPIFIIREILEAASTLAYFYGTFSPFIVTGLLISVASLKFYSIFTLGNY